MTEETRRPGDHRSWGPDAEGNVRAHVVEGWQMQGVAGMCLMRIGTEPEEDGGRPLAVNFALTADQADEIARGLRQIARRLRAERGTVQ